MFFFQGFLAPDDKIYILSENGCQVMTVIENPNKKGLACNVVQHAIEMPTRYDSSLPNFPNYRLGPLVGSDCYPEVAKEDLEVDVFPNPASDMLVISLKENAGIAATFELFSMLGVRVFSARLDQRQEYYYLSLPDLTPGMYGWWCRMTLGWGVGRFLWSEELLSC